MTIETLQKCFFAYQSYSSSSS